MHVQKLIHPAIQLHQNVFPRKRSCVLQADHKMDVDQTSWAVMREISKMAYNVDADQIKRAVNQLKAQTLFSQDGPSGEPETL